ncbi:nucleotidyltransferase family protein [Kineosporia babensis]
MRIAGVVLAAGAGTRMGRPKGLVADARGVPWVRLAVTAMGDACCQPVVVVTGAAGSAVRELVPAEAVVVHAAGWAGGMSVSLLAGLRYLADLPSPPDAVVVGLVDMPDVTAAVVERLRHAAQAAFQATSFPADSVAAPARVRSVLAHATYVGQPGHPVLLGRDHWPGILATATGDMGARNYLRGRDDLILVECGDLASGADIDSPGPDVT